MGESRAGSGDSGHSSPSGQTAAKASLRERMLAVRAALPDPWRAQASRRIHHLLDSLAELGDADNLLGYAAFGSEVSLDDYLVALGRTRAVHLPWVDGEDLAIARVRDWEADLRPGWRGLREPRPGWRRSVSPDQLDAVLVPGVAFDRRGQRLGYGGGHFDRLLARVRPGTVVVGVAFGAQVVDHVPTEAHDIPVDVVVTESVVLRPGA